MKAVTDFIVINAFLYFVMWLEGWNFERGDNVGWLLICGTVLTGIAILARKEFDG